MSPGTEKNETGKTVRETGRGWQEMVAGRPSATLSGQTQTGPGIPKTVRRSVTLLELVIVVVILAMLAAIAMPRYANAITQQRLEAATRRIILDLAYAQRRARITSVSQSVVFSTADHTYTLPGMAGLDHPGTVYTVALSQPPYEATLVSADFDGDTTFTYDGYGTPRNGVGGTLVIHVGSRSATITVDGETGAVSSP